MQEKIYLNAFNLLHLEYKELKAIFAYFKSWERAWNASNSELERFHFNESVIEKLINRSSTVNPQDEWQKLKKEKIELILIDDEKYPYLLKQIPSPPFGLYALGVLENLEKPLAIVGSRKLSTYGKDVTEKIAFELAELGITLISGFAVGIDSLVHKAAIRAKKPTIGALGCGLDSKTIYPWSNRILVQRVLEFGGALVSEYPIKTPPLKHNFPQRNRIISGLSLGTLVIEAREKSGALITAFHALDQNREVFAIPGNIHQPNSEGTNKLIKKGAVPVSQTADILEVLWPELLQEKQQKLPSSLTEEESVIVTHLSREPLHIDELVKLTKLDSSKIISLLSIMEINGLVKNIGNMNYVSNI